MDLPGQTEALLLEEGWVKHDHWRRELWSLSFWRILQKRRDPAAFDDRLMFEEVPAEGKRPMDGGQRTLRTSTEATPGLGSVSVCNPPSP